MLSSADCTSLENGKLLGPAEMQDVEHLLATCAIETVESGEHLLEPGNSNHNLYLVLEGELLVYPGGAGLPEHVALGPGDCVGEMSLIDGHQASALVIPSCETRLLVVPHDVVWTMIERSHGIARNLLGIFAGRIRNDNLALVASQSGSLEFEVSASVDTLTGLHNQRWMQSAFARAMQRCEHDAAALCLVLVNVDHLSSVNDEFGHVIGDGVLRMVARKLVEGLRSQDLLVRSGGDDFALLLPQTTLEEGFQIADRLRLAIAAQPIVVGSSTADPVTVSCGIANMIVSDRLDQLMAAAREALQQSKLNGRDQVLRSVVRAAR